MGIHIISLFSVIILFFVIIESVRRGILETKYSILWIITCIFMGIISANGFFINWLANLLGVYYAPSLLFLFGLLFVIILIFDLTRRISKLSRQLATLTQEHSLLKEKCEKGNE